jgi:hypothetical protein
MIGRIDEEVAVSESSSPQSPIYKQPVARIEQPVSKPESQNSKLETPIPKLETSQHSSMPQPGVNTGRSLGQILIVLVVVLVLVNIPINYYGLGLAHIIPDSTTVAIYDGLVLKGSGGPEIYVLEDHKLRWLSSPEARGSYFHSANVRTVEDSLLEQFEQGQPIRRLVKCHNSSLVYALENGQKRWVENPPPEDKANKPWDKVYQVTCNFLDGLPDGLPIPENAGTPPHP